MSGKEKNSKDPMASLFGTSCACFLKFNRFHFFFCGISDFKPNEGRMVRFFLSFGWDFSTGKLEDDHPLQKK